MRRMLAVVATGMLLSACSADPTDDDMSRVGQPASISHIHGLGVDAAGTLYVATHYGLIKIGSDGKPIYASADTNDHMGFTVHPREGVMFRSGHSPEKPSLGVESSTDGARWTHLSDVTDPPVDFHSMTVSFADSDALWGWDSGLRGTFRSADGGKTWSRLEARGIESHLSALAGTAEKDLVLAGTASGLYRSRDAGATWTRMLGRGATLGVATDPNDSKHILVSTQTGVQVTDDGGATWRTATTGLPANADITHLTVSPTDRAVAYAANSSTIYKTTDGARSWTLMPTG